MRFAVWMAVVGLVVFLLVGCGGGNDRETAEGNGREEKKLQTVRMSLEGFPDAENVAVLMADQRGYFADEGLYVEIVDPIDPDNVPGYVAQGADDVGLLSQPQIVMAQDKGMQLVAIGSLVPRPTMAMIWLKNSKIDDIADLEGKTIAINGLPFEEAFLQVILARAGLTRDDVKVKSVAYELVPALISGQADAVLGGSWNVEGIELEARGLEPVITPLQQFGIPSYEELVVIVRRDRLSRNPRWIRSFMSALARGRAAVLEDPEAAAEAITVGMEEEEPSISLRPEVTMAKAEATLPLLSKGGYMSSSRATRLVDWMYAQRLIQRKLPSSALLTNRYVEPRR